MVSLRPYQTTGIENLRAEFRAGRTRVCVVSPTGSGKTVLGSEIARLKTVHGRRVAWLAHRNELIDQAAASLEALGLTVGVVSAKSTRRPNPYAPIQVASVQTLLARGQRPPADLIVADECHHFVAKSLLGLLSYYPDAQLVGLTATPQRGDGRSLGDVFNGMIVVATIPELIAQGHLVPCNVVRPGKPLRAGQIAQRPVDAYRAHCVGRSALVFSPNIREAGRHTAEFVEAGIPAVMVEGRTGRGIRQQALSGFKAGNLPVIVNVGVLTEGTDLPVCSAVVLARGCGTEGLYLQITGRGMRPYAGKTDMVLCDLRGVSWTLGHPSSPREYSLEGAGISHASEPNPYPACRVCGAPVTPGEGCSECGTGVAEMKPLVVTGHALEPYAWMRTQGEDKRAKSLAKWIKQGIDKGYKQGWALNRYRVVYGHWAPNEVQAMAKRIMEERK